MAAAALEASPAIHTQRPSGNLPLILRLP